MNIGKMRNRWRKEIDRDTRLSCFFVVLLVVSCQPQTALPPGGIVTLPVSEPIEDAGEPEVVQPTQFPTRTAYSPGELVEYIAQTGDTLPVLAIHFNTSIEEILEANPIIPASATTLPPGMPMEIPIYYEPFWGSQFRIIPDSYFINGPSQINFNTKDFTASQPGWFSEYSEYAAGSTRSGAQIVDFVAQNFSISPQILLALLDYKAQALSQKNLPETIDMRYILGIEDLFHQGVYLQLVLAADMLNDAYYSRRGGMLESLDFPDGSIENIDPWQNTATAALMKFFSVTQSKVEYQSAVSPEGLASNFKRLFGDPWVDPQPHIPGSLQQPEMLLPFEAGKTWAYTGGPHTGWGTGEPWAAVDFAPPSTAAGCIPSNEWNTAVADGVVARVDEGILELDLDGDGDLRTGWVVFYLHIATVDRAQVGKVLTAGQPLGHPSCEGGTTTGTHIHIARKYNGEWIAADGSIPFNLEGWVAHSCPQQR